jgi:hypothetical protein
VTYLFGKVPRALMEHGEVRAVDLAVYAALATHCDFESHEGNPGVRALAHLAHVHPNTVPASIARLVAAGFVSVVRGSCEDRRPNRYRLLRHAECDVATSRTSQPVVGGVTTSGMLRHNQCDEHVTTSVTEREENLPDTQNRARKRKPAAAAAASVTIPLSLDTPEFRVAWAEWLAYRHERRLTCTARTLTAQLTALEGMGEPAAIESIRTSIGAGWQGLFPPKQGGGNGQPRSPARVVAAPGKYAHRCREGIS